MRESIFMHASILMFGVFISSISQVILKKATQKDYGSILKEYANPYVLFAYILFFGATLLSVIAYRKIPLSFGPILEATSYIYVTYFGKKYFGEKITKQKKIALGCIIIGIVIYSVSS